MTSEATKDLDNLCTSACDSEYLYDKSLAISQHQQAIDGLQHLLASSQDKERKKVAKKQIKFHNARRQLLEKVGNGGLLKLLPTYKSAQDELSAGSKTSISMDQWRLTQYQQPYATDPNAQIPPDAIHLLTQPIPLYTPTLPSYAPSVFDIHCSTEMNGLLGGNYFLIKAKDPDTHQTLYVLKLLKQRGRQFASATLYRAAEFVGRPAVAVTISQVDVRQLKGVNGSCIGRNLVLNNGLGFVEEKMDRQMKPQWDPRRFSYGGRNFVWKRRADSLVGVGPQDLYETTRVWPEPFSKTGKFLDDVVEDGCLSWGEMKPRITKLSQVCVKGGIDQVFMEHILASQMTKIIVELRGHD